MKKFYTLVSHHKTPEGYEVHLDGKPVKTPMRTTLYVPNEALADRIVQEWVAQTDDIIPDTMPLTQMISTKIDRVVSGRTKMTEMVMKYLNTDLLCYRTDHPPELATQQADIWDPILVWFSTHFDIAALETTTGIQAIIHPQNVHDAVLAFMDGLDDDRFTILQLVTSVAGSLILAIAFVKGQVNAQDVFRASHVEEDFKAALYNEEQYGKAPGQGEKDEMIRRDLEACALYLSSLYS